MPTIHIPEEIFHKYLQAEYKKSPGIVDRDALENARRTIVSVLKEAKK